jgi:8-oxo-dGTP pyrophosphatase MutT (NUDIX family)
MPRLLPHRGRAALLCCAGCIAPAIVLAQDASELPRTVVTPSRTAQPIAEALPATSIITREEIDRWQSADLVSILGRETGVQFALPGGRLEPGESLEQAALRELHEELGVLVAESRVLGLLDDFATRSGFAITPVVLWAPDVTTLVPDPDEVAVAYRLPLADLFAPTAPILTPTADPERPILSLPLAGTTVFSPTAAILYQLREVALCGRPTRVHHYEQPMFAWR